MRLRMKILSGFLILAMMLLVAGVVSIYEFSKIGSLVQNLLDDNYKSIDAAKHMVEALEREDSAVLLLLLGKWEKGRSIITHADSSFSQAFNIANSNLTISGEQTLLDSIWTCYSAYKDLWLKPIVGTMKQGDLDWYFNDVHRSFLAVKSSVDNLLALNDNSMYQTASGLKNRANRAIMPGIVAIVAALVFSLLFYYFVNVFMVSPIVKITKGINKCISNKVPFYCKIDTTDEILDLSTAISVLCSKANLPTRL